ncbi:hypothetical protein C2E31_13515 [Rhodopirellula baltica]|nr:hypothetical protein C2E31_13515 [Rhodopirellula baltica]
MHSVGCDGTLDQRETVADTALSDTEPDEERKLRCTSCGSESVVLSEVLAKPSWAVVLSAESQCSPWWYRESLKRREKRLWDAAMGDGFYDWYTAHLKSMGEGAREAPECNSNWLQPYLPGIGILSETDGM